MARVGVPGDLRMVAKLPRKTPFANLRPSADYSIEWEAVEEAPALRARTEFLGLSNEDRAALGLTPSAGPSTRASTREGRDGEDARVVLSRALR